MAQHLDDFFERAINTARDLGKARKKTRQKQQDFENLATNKAFALEERRVTTGEKRAETQSTLGQGQLDLGRAQLAVRKTLGLGQLKIGQRQVGVAEGGLGLRRSRQEETSALFKSLFPQGDKDQASGVTSSFRARSDQGVLDAASSLAKNKRPSVLRNPKVQEVVRKAKERGGLQSTLEQDLLLLR